MQEDKQEPEELFEHFSLKVDAGQEALRIDKFLINHMPKISRNRIQNAALAGSIVVNEKSVKSNYKVRGGDHISILLPKPPRSVELVGEDIPLDIVHEDEELMVINKPPGLVVHPGHGNFTGTLVNALIYYLDQKSDRPGAERRPYLVHRIDKNTSGLMVIAKTELAMNVLAKQFFDHSIQRTYKALVWGDPDPPEGQIEGNIGRHPRFRKKMYVFAEGEDGKPSLTHYKVLQSYHYVSVVECRLETGRTHQIRVHLSYIGHPVFNDEVYGGNHIVKGTIYTKYKQFVQNRFSDLPRHALHAGSLGFVHPATKKDVFFEIDPPADFTSVIERWATYTEALKTDN